MKKGCFRRITERDILFVCASVTPIAFTGCPKPSEPVQEEVKVDKGSPKYPPDYYVDPSNVEAEQAIEDATPKDDDFTQPVQD